MTGRMNRLRSVPASVVSMSLSCRKRFQKKRSSARCHSGAFPGPMPASCCSCWRCNVFVRSQPYENHMLPAFRPCSTRLISSFSIGLPRIACVDDWGFRGRRRKSVARKIGCERRRHEGSR